MFSMRSVITERHAVTLHRGSVGVTVSRGCHSSRKCPTKTKTLIRFPWPAIVTHCIRHVKVCRNSRETPSEVGVCSRAQAQRGSRRAGGESAGSYKAANVQFQMSVCRIEIQALQSSGIVHLLSKRRFSTLQFSWGRCEQRATLELGSNAATQNVIKQKSNFTAYFFGASML